MEVLSQLRMPRLKRSCCGCSLELGTKIIALVHLIIYGGFFVIIFVWLSIDEYEWYKKETDSYGEFENAFIRDEFATTLVVSTVMYSVVLYMGVTRKDNMLFVPWLVHKSVMFFANIMYMLEIVEQQVSFGYKNNVFFIHLANMGADFYQICVVYSFLKQLDAKG